MRFRHVLLVALVLGAAYTTGADAVFGGATLVRGRTGGWTVKDGPSGRKMLHHPAAMACEDHVFDPQLSGWHRIFVTTYREKAGQSWYQAMGKVRLDNLKWRAVFGDRHGIQEREYLAADLTGRKLIFTTLQDRPANFVQVRCVPMSEDEVAEHKADLARPRERELHGINDSDDWFWVYSSRDQMSVYDMIGQHKAVGCNRIYWINGAGALTYETTIERRYPGEKNRPWTQRSAWMAANVPILSSACKYAHEQGLELWAWYRMNNEFGNGYETALNSEFFNTKPQFREKHLNGQLDGGRLSFAYPEVRAYKRAVCCEMIQLGCDGLLLGGLRHPPMLLWADPICGGFAKRFGTDPRKKALSARMMKEFYAYRASFMTTFIEELREDLRRLGRGSTPISLRIAMDGLDQNLRDGFDVETLVQRRLIQELCLHGNYLGNRVYLPYAVPGKMRPYRELVRGTNVRIVGAIDGGITPSATNLLNYARFFHTEGAQGFAIYESDFVFQNPALRTTLPALCQIQRITEPYFSVSSSSTHGALPWQPDFGDEKPHLQLNFPQPTNVTRLQVEALPQLPIQLTVSPDGRSFTPIVSRRTKQGFEAEVGQQAKCMQFSLIGPWTATDPLIRSGRVGLDGGRWVRFGLVRGDRIRIDGIREGQVLSGKAHALAVLAAGASGPVLFYLDNILVRTERAYPFEWFFDTSGFENGPHTLRLEMPDPMALEVPFCEVTFSIENPGKPAAQVQELSGPLLYRARLQQMAPGSIHGQEGWEVLRREPDLTFSKAAAEEMTARVQATSNGRQQLTMLSRGKPEIACVARKQLGRAVGRGALDLAFRLPRPGRKTCMILGEGEELCIVVYLGQQGQLGYQGDRQNGPPLPTPAPLRPAAWNRLRIVWDAATDKTDIYLNDLSTPKGKGLGQRRPLKKGVDSIGFYFWSRQADLLLIEDMRVVALSTPE